MAFQSVSVLLLILFFSVCSAQTELRNRTFQVGVVLDLDSFVGRMGMTSMSLALSDVYSLNPNYRTKLVIHVRNSSGQVIGAAASALNLLKDVEVDAIIGPQNSAQAIFVIGLGDKANVPVISFSATSPSIHPQTPYFVQTALNDAAQVSAISAIVEYFHWNQVVIIYEESDFGNGMITYLSNALQDVNARISYRSVIPIAATGDMMLSELYKMKTMQTRVFVVHISSSLASRFFLNVKEAGMMSKDYAWIVTSSVMDLLFSLDSHVVESMQGVLGVKPYIPKTRKLKYTAIWWKRKFLHDYPEYSQAKLSMYGLWAYDTLWALAMAAEKVQFSKSSSSAHSSILNSTNPFTTEVSQTGPKLLEAILSVTFKGLTGDFHLIKGKLQPSSFQILNVVGDGEKEVGMWSPSHGILSEDVTFSNFSAKRLKTVVFPGDSTHVPKGWEVPISGKKLRIGVPVEAGFPEMLKVEKNFQTNVSIISGCYIDMFDAVIAAMPYAVPYEYFPFEKRDGSSAGTYDELIYQIFLQNYDAVVGDITITSKRSKFTDFALPFTPGGVTMVVPTAYNNPNDKLIFWKPFSTELWLSALGLFIFTGLAIWIIEHRFNKSYRDISMIFYFPFMSLVFAQREKIVTDFARVAVIFWVFFILVLNSTYTASLSARLTVQQLRPVVTEVEQLKRNGAYVGCHRGGFTCDLVQGLGFEKSKIRGYKQPADVDEAFTKGSKNGGISAFFSVRPYTNLFVSKYCEKYITVGPTYPTEGFAFVFQKESPLVADVSRAVIELTENGRISEIEGQWIKSQKCNETDSSLTFIRVSFQSLQLLFGITVGVTTICLLLCLANYVYKYWGVIQVKIKDKTTLCSKFCTICKHFNEGDPDYIKTPTIKGTKDEEPASPSSAANPSPVAVEFTESVAHGQTSSVNGIAAEQGNLLLAIEASSSEEITDHPGSAPVM